MSLVSQRGSPTLAPGPARDEHLAIVDDDVAVGRALARLIKANSYAVQVYGSASEFLDSLKAGTPDCLIVDLQMEGMTGLQLVHHLADMGLRIPVIFVTARDEPGMQQACEATGAVAFLLKPVMSEPLFGAIDAALKGSARSVG